MARLAVYLQLAAHFSYQFFTDAKTQTRPAVFTGGFRIGLCKAVEDEVFLFRRNANARIDYGKIDIRNGVGEMVDMRPQGDGACLREFGGIGEEIQEHLFEPHLIAHYLFICRNGFGVEDEADVLLLYGSGNGVGCLLEDFGEIEWRQ